MDKRSQQIVHASIVSVVGNSLLAILKIVAGLLSGSIAVLSDGIDSASDVIISVVMLFAAKIMNKPPNEHYAYGYHKVEGVATKALSFIIFYAGIQMLITAIGDLIHPASKSMPDTMVVYVIVVSILAKIGLSVHQTRKGKQLESQMLIANGINMRNDVITSVGVLAGLLFTLVLEMPILDSITALAVSLLIIRSSINIFKDSSMQLMDGVSDVEVYKQIFDAVRNVEGAHTPHKVRSRTVGAMHSIVLDIEVEGHMSIAEGHRIAHEVENKIREAIPQVFDIVVHVEPLGDSRSGEAYGVNEESEIRAKE